MSRLRVQCLSLSIDGFCAGPQQSREHPLGLGGPALSEWMFKTETFQQMFGGTGGSTGVDNDFVLQGFRNVGAWILGRNMFGPIRGAWPDDGWKGWWGDNPPYHTDVFVLTHHPRPALPMEGGTTFHFVTDGIHAALERARAAAGNRDVRVGGGANTIRQYLQERLIDELHFAVAPVVLGSGESVFGGLDLAALGYQCSRHVATAEATHYVLVKK